MSITQLYESALALRNPWTYEVPLNIDKKEPPPDVILEDEEDEDILGAPYVLNNKTHIIRAFCQYKKCLVQKFCRPEKLAQRADDLGKKRERMKQMANDFYARKKRVFKNITKFKHSSKILQNLNVLCCQNIFCFLILGVSHRQGRLRCTVDS